MHATRSAAHAKTRLEEAVVERGAEEEDEEDEAGYEGGGEGWGGEGKSAQSTGTETIRGAG